MAGAEVAQLYLTLPAATATAAAGAGQGTTRLPPVKHALSGFTKVMLAAGASATVEFSLKPEQLTVVGADGGRATCTGTVGVAVAGHLPSDPRAKLSANSKHASNVLSGSFELP